MTRRGVTLAEALVATVLALLVFGLAITQQQQDARDLAAMDQRTSRSAAFLAAREALVWDLARACPPSAEEIEALDAPTPVLLLRVTRRASGRLDPETVLWKLDACGNITRAGRAIPLLKLSRIAFQRSAGRLVVTLEGPALGVPARFDLQLPPAWTQTAGWSFRG